MRIYLIRWKSFSAKISDTFKFKQSFFTTEKTNTLSILKDFFQKKLNINKEVYNMQKRGENVYTLNVGFSTVIVEITFLSETDWVKK